MNKTYQELCDEILELHERLEAAKTSANLARLTTRQAVAKAEELERERDHANTVAARYLEELHDTQRGMREARAEAVEQAAIDLYDAQGLTKEALDFLGTRAEQLRGPAMGGGQ